MMIDVVVRQGQLGRCFALKLWSTDFVNGKVWFQQCRLKWISQNDISFHRKVFNYTLTSSSPIDFQQISFFWEISTIGMKIGFGVVFTSMSSFSKVLDDWIDVEIPSNAFERLISTGSIANEHVLWKIFWILGAWSFCGKTEFLYASTQVLLKIVRKSNSSKLSISFGYETEIHFIPYKEDQGRISMQAS